MTVHQWGILSVFSQESSKSSQLELHRYIQMWHAAIQHLHPKHLYNLAVYLNCQSNRVLPLLCKWYSSVIALQVSPKPSVLLQSFNQPNHHPSIHLLSSVPNLSVQTLQGLYAAGSDAFRAKVVNINCTATVCKLIFLWKHWLTSETLQHFGWNHHRPLHSEKTFIQPDVQLNHSCIQCMHVSYVYECIWNNPLISGV